MWMRFEGIALNVGVYMQNLNYGGRDFYENKCHCTRYILA